MGEDWAPEGPARRTGATDPTRPAGAASWDVGDALETVRDGYVASHGRPPLDALGDTGTDVPRARRRRGTPRVRWLVSWRVAATAAVVVVLAAGTVAARTSGHASGPVVEIPAPGGASAPTGRDAAAGDGGSLPSGSSAGVTAAAAVPDPGPVVVHVVGAVAVPGVVRLPDGARVDDALTAAGGPTADADLSTVNLARVVVDGEQVLVRRVGEQAAPGASGPPSTGPATGAGTDPAAPVDLNTADVAALDALPGIGPVLAQRIVDHRTARPFGTVDELADVRGIGPALLENLRPLVRV